MTGHRRHRQGPAVLVVCHYYPPHVGGIEEVARAEANGLAALGWAVAVLTSSPGARRSPLPRDPGVRVIAVRACNTLQRFGVPFPLFFLPTLLYRSWMEVGRADVVHIHDTLYLSSWAAAVCCRLRHTPFVMTKHVAVVAHPWWAVAVTQRFVYGTIGGFVARSAAVVFYVNTGVRDSLLAGGTSSRCLAALANGVDLSFFEPPPSPAERSALRSRLQLPDDRPLALFVGRLVHKKGYRQLIEAAQRQEAWVAVLVGDGDVVETTPQVIAYGSQDRATVRMLYQACDIFVLPSQSEGFPLTVQEAMASGLPVITTDDPGYEMYGLDPELITLLGSNSPSLHHTIDALVADPEARQRMSTYSRRFAEDNFSWDLHVAALRRTYEDLTTNCQPGHPVAEMVRS
jgi:D-inositol-3-phosphate glycosyltransferase